MNAYTFRSSLLAKQIYSTSQIRQHQGRELTFTYDNNNGRVLASMPSAACSFMEELEVLVDLKPKAYEVGREFFCCLVKYIIEPLLEKTAILYLDIERVAASEFPHYVDEYKFYPEGWDKPLVTVKHSLILREALISETMVIGKDSIKEKLEQVMLVATPSRTARRKLAKKLWYQRALMTRINRSIETGSKFSVKEFNYLNNIKIKSNQFKPLAGGEALVFRHLNYLTYCKGYSSLVCVVRGGNLECYDDKTKIRVATLILDEELRVVDIEYLYFGFRYSRCSENTFYEDQPFAVTLTHVPHKDEIGDTVCLLNR